MRERERERETQLYVFTEENLQKSSGYKMKFLYKLLNVVDDAFNVKKQQKMNESSCLLPFPP